MTQISIIVPCYNQAQYLDECLESVLNQTFQEWECIVVDDGSTDNTKHIAENWIKNDTRFKYIFTENSGPSAARNKAIEIAQGIIIYPLDSDDKIAPTLIEKIVSKFNDSENSKVVYSDVLYFGVKIGKYNLPEYNYKRLLLQNCFIACSAYLKSDWLRIGGYDETLKSFEDWDFWIRILDKNSKVFKIEEDLYYYRKHQYGYFWLSKFLKLKKIFHQKI